MAPGGFPSSHFGVPENYFDDWIAQRCERLWPEVFDPAVVQPAVEFLADLAGSGAVHVGGDEIDVASQNSWSHHLWFIDGETKRFSPPFRYVWPAERDLMARIAGMRLHQRWSDWNRGPFTSHSRSHISVWQKAS